jgi:hypothetical protein
MRRLGFFALLLALPAAGHAQPEKLRATLSCQPEVGYSRLLCRVDFRAAPAGRLVWADALVTRAPASLQPLRARVLAKLADDARSGQAGLGFVSSAGGAGKVGVRARAVVCERDVSDPAGCRPFERELSSDVTLP